MSKLWKGLSDGLLDKKANDFNSSISIDKRLYKEDIGGSIAHATMLSASGIISEEEGEQIINGLAGILEDIESGLLIIDNTAEDIHSFVEGELTARIGEAGKKLHTARSRNDQVATDIRLYVKKEIAALKELIFNLMKVIVDKAEQNQDAIMPGYTHLQRAQPITFSHHLMAYFQMFKRDVGRLDDCLKRTDISPLGSAALAGTGYPIDMQYSAKLLGFAQVAENSLDAVSDRDFLVELAACLALIITHLSRFSEEIILWASWEFKFIDLDTAYSTGSSIMPQKKNPDIAELVRGKSGRVFGSLITLLTMLKGLPLAYNKDMQEDKEAIFDGIDTVKLCLEVFAPMLDTLKVNKDNMSAAAGKGFINATDAADYLVSKGLTFRTAYEITGKTVAYCMQNGYILENLPLEKYQEYSPHFQADIYDAVDMQNCLNKRSSNGGAGTAAMQISNAKKYLKKEQ
ncbi:MAG: argininosuccinate lyase [Clostridia bacterium]